MDNSFFIHYGRLSERCFSGSLEPDEPFSFFPDMVADTKTAQVTEQNKKHLLDYADPDQLNKATKAAERLRSALLAEAKDESAQIAPPTTQKFKIFQKGLAQGSEAMLAENPFYELTALIYKLNVTAIQNAFAASQKDAGANLPQAMKVSRSLRYLWGREGSMIRLEDKILETVGSFLSIGKILLGLLLFIGSTLTTAKGVNDLVQHDSFVALFGDFLLGASHENIRLILTLTVGVVLSSIILDFKDRLFQGVAETGKVFQGFLDAFKRFPRWMILSLFFTMASIWTNYDGIVLLFSKTQDLAYQLEVIQERVGRALGDEKDIDPDKPDSLLDLKGLLEKKIATSSKQFEQVVEDEMMGVASSGIASKGPRYWSKYFIIHGGYKPGTNDVVRAIGRSKFNQRLDRMLQKSDLDLTTPLDEKLQKILKTYQAQYAQMNQAVNKRMGALANKMTLQSYSVDEITALFNLEAYHVNQSVQEVVALMEKNKTEFGKAANAINRIAESHISFLREVDKVGIPSKTEYTIDVKIEIPRVEAIDQLNQSEIPMAERRSVMELKSLLLERYGAAVGASILFWILFIAVFMDLSDPIFYSTMVARWGRKDRHFLQENIKRFQIWEDEYIQHIRSFLARPDIRSTIPHISCPRTPVLHWVYHQYLESLAPFVKDHARMTATEKFRFWFFGLFSTTRIRYAEVYNARQSMTRKILAGPEALLPPLLNRLYGDLFQPFSISSDHFDTRHKNITAHMRNNDDRFGLEIGEISKIIDDFYELYPEIATQSRNMKLHHNVLIILHSGGGLFGRKVRNKWFSDLVYNLFSRPIARSDFNFSLTRNNWMVDQAVLRKKSHIYIDSLTPYQPILTKLLSETVPKIKKELLYPLINRLEDIPKHQELKRVLNVERYHNECLDFEREMLTVLGMSSGQGLRIDNALFSNILGHSTVDEIPAIFIKKDRDASVLEKKADYLAEKLRVALDIVTRLSSERKQTVSILTRIRTDSLRPIASIFEKFTHRELIEEAVGLNILQRDLSSLDSFIISLWGSNRLDLIKVEDSSDSRINLLLTKLGMEGNNHDFSLLQLATTLEKDMLTIKKDIESKVFLLTFMDKTVEKTKVMISQSFKTIANIYIQEAKLNSEQQTADKDTKEKLNFIQDRNLFLQSVPMFLETGRSQLMSLKTLKEIIATGKVDPLRTLEGQIFKTSNFLENTIAYLNGERGPSGINAPLDLIEETEKPDLEESIDPEVQ
ncbi:MAG: hypothetical protein HQL69_14360 [Magnetococcales bacterium]|nr:hypothetical protein [Magnetococcales bacterium]